MATRRQQTANEDSIDRLRACMAPDQWDAAIRLQCAVRDAIGCSVELVEALDLMTIAVRAGLIKPQAKKYAAMIQDRKTNKEKARLLEQQRISERAGKS